MHKKEFVVLRAISFNGSTIEKDRFMGTANTKKEAEDAVSIFNKDVKNLIHTLKGININFYLEEYET